MHHVTGRPTGARRHGNFAARPRRRPVRYSLRMGNLYNPEWDVERDEPPYRWRRARLGRQAGCRRLGASLFEVAPGAATFPLHIHYANEELLVVVDGRPTLRTLDGTRVLEPGELVAFPAGREGAHRISNDSDEPARVLVVSTMHAPDINEFPDEGRFWVRDYVPGTDPPDGALDLHLRPLDAES
jgi:uncharacterized cupin superfamily protein